MYIDGWTIIIFGASGDLSQRKLIPALHEIVKKIPKNDRPSQFFIIGAAYDTVDFSNILAQSRKFITSPDEDVLSYMSDHGVYQHLNFTKKSDFSTLAHCIKDIEQANNLPGKRLVYLAASADFYCDITKYSAQSGIIECGNENHRVVYEKPFGSDIASAEHINACISQYLASYQVYRVDHFLGKAFINNIILLRFTNTLFASTWNNRSIDSIEIMCPEKIDAEDRCDFYEQFGAIKDMVQSHLLQMLALTTMQQPDDFSFAELAAKKLDILKHIVPEAGVLGQYRGYCVDERSADSHTDTFVALRFRIETQNWKGVPCYITTGKALAEKCIKIRITYKPIIKNVFEHESSYNADILTIEIAPKTGFMLQVNSKQPEEMHHVMPVTMEFCHSCLYAPYTRAAYEVLFRALMEGDRSLSVSLEEIEEQWRIIEQVYDLDMPFTYYDKGTSGPSTAQIKKGQ